MAIQDLGRLHGKWRLGLAEEGETFQGVSGKMIICRDEEILLRDENGIVWSLLQGPDFRTRVHPPNRNIVVYVFTAPGVLEDPVAKGIQLAINLLEKFGNGKESWWKVIKP